VDTAKHTPDESANGINVAKPIDMDLLKKTVNQYVRIRKD